MATSKYDKVTRTFTAVWKDYAKEAKGKKYPYGRKSEKWKGDKLPTPSEIKARKKELLEEALEAERKSKEKAQFITKHGDIDDIQAYSYLYALEDEDLSKSQTMQENKKSRVILLEFLSWLDENYKSIALSQLDTDIARHYYRYLRNQKFTYQTIKRKTSKIHFVLNGVAKKLKGFTNPFNEVKINDEIKLVKPYKKKKYNGYQLSYFLRSTLENENKYKQLQDFSIFYFLMVTGWRVRDILLLTWKQIDMTSGIIRLKHSKTKDNGIETELKISSIMRRILLLLKKLQDKAPNDWKGYLFPLNKEGASKSHSTYRKLIYRFEKIRKELDLTHCEKIGRLYLHDYTIHSFRGTVITSLLKAKFQEAFINKLVGHAPRTTEEESYITVEPDDLTKLVEHMEEESLALEILQDLALFKDSFCENVVMH